MADAVEARYLLEVYELTSSTSGFSDPFDRGRARKSLVRSILLPNVSKAEVIRVPATARTWTLGLLPVKEARGYRQNNIYVTGHSGQEEALYGKGNGTLQVMTGKAAFEELRAFLEMYEADAAKWRSAVTRDSRAPWLVFRMLWEGEAYVVDHVRLRENRDTMRSRNSYAYDLQMLSELDISSAVLDSENGSARADASGESANDRIVWSYAASKSIGSNSSLAGRAAAARAFGLATGVSPVTDVVGGDVIAQERKEREDLEQRLQRHGGSLESLSVTDGPLKEFFGGTGAYQGITKAIDGFSGALRDVNTAIDRGGIDRIERLGVSLSTTAAQPQAAVLTLLRQSERAKDAIERAFDGLDINTRRRAASAVKSAFATINAIISPFELSFGVNDRDGYGQSPFAPSPIPSSGADFSDDGFVEVEVIRGDSLQSIAQRELGDGGRADELRRVNQMISSWEMADGTPLGPGVIIRIPDPNGIVSLDTGDPLGGDWMWDATARDWVVLGDGSDFAIVQGPDNLRQSVTRRASTVQGSVGAYPTFGLPRLKDSVVTLGAVGYLASHAAESFREDPRVAAVKDLVVAGEDDMIVLSADLVVANKKGSRLPLATPVGGAL